VSADPEIAKYADTLQLMTCAQNASSEIAYHAVVSLCFSTFAFTIDHSLRSSAFKVPLGGEFAMFSYLPLFSDVGQERLKYFLTANGTYTLTMDSCIDGCPWPILSFTPQDASTAIAQLTIPAASEVNPLKDDKDILLPPRKYVSIRTPLDEPPEHIPSAPLHGKFLTTAARIQVDFGDAALLMQIPRADWLKKAQGKKWAGITQFMRYIEKSEATSHVLVRLSAKTNDKLTQLEQKQLTLLGALTAEFGLDPKVVWEMADSIFRAWGPFREPVVLTAPRCAVDVSDCP
jgi:hypothetical protein